MRFHNVWLLAICVGIIGGGRQYAEAAYLSPFEMSGKKVRLSLDKLRVPGVTSPEIELAFLIDESCAASRLTLHAGFAALNPPRPAAPGKRSYVQTHKVTSQPGISPNLDWVEKDPCVLGVAHNRAAFADELPNDPLLARQPHLSAIQFLPSYPFFSDEHAGRDAVIAVIDTGIDLTHVDLSANLWVNEQERGGRKGIDDDGNGFVDDVHGYNFVSEIGNPSHETANDHGTHVAGLAAAVPGNQVGVVGVAGSRARIMALNVFGKNWGTETVYIDKAIRYAADNGADVINISINGGGESDTTAAAIAYALGKGTLVVTSAGNRGEDIGQFFTFPASYADRYPGLFAVGAIDLETRLPCEFSNFNPRFVKLAAPGCDTSVAQKGIYSTRKENMYGYKSGTSMAAPIVAGALAMTYTHERESDASAASPEAVEATFLRGAEPIADLERYFGGGRIVNLLRLMDVLRN